MELIEPRRKRTAPLISALEYSHNKVIFVALAANNLSSMEYTTASKLSLVEDHPRPKDVVLNIQNNSPPTIPASPWDISYWQYGRALLYVPFLETVWPILANTTNTLGEVKSKVYYKSNQ
ncbi:hypothetical protein QCA50_018694 [Cerrena zonata]|uniref:Uncharacterized protein n=1 Tax=Cerrena zonata TaxID=2478898 RepID=A0AAW0FAM4_9APHY